MTQPDGHAQPSTSRLRRWIYAAAGVCCVGLGALGVFLPGVPTTVFLIAASFLFTRSCPWLEHRLIRTRFFAPFLPYLDQSRPMPARAKVIALILMWTMVTISTITLARNSTIAGWIAIMPVAAACIGTWFILRFGLDRIARD